MPPNRIAHYELGEKIGAGGMGEVYRATDTKLNRDVTLKDGVRPVERLGEGVYAELLDELKEHVARKIGAVARPDRIILSHDLPKSRSGKIMRRLLRDIAQGKTLGDTTTLTDAGVLDQLKARYAEEAE